MPQGPQGWLPRCLIPCAHSWFHRTPQGPQWWPTGCWVPHRQTKTLRCRGPKVGPLGAPSPPGLLGVRSPGRPLCGVTGSPQRPLPLLCKLGGARVHWVGLGGPWVGRGGPGRLCVGCWCWRGVWAGGPLSLSPSRLVCPWWAPPPVAQTAHLGCRRHLPPDAG